MEASRSQNGIQLLLAAEQEAQHIVNAARQGMHAFLICLGSSFPDLLFLIAVIQFANIHLTTFMKI